MRYFINANFASDQIRRCISLNAIFKHTLFVSGVQNGIVHFYNGIIQFYSRFG